MDSEGRGRGNRPPPLPIFSSIPENSENEYKLFDNSYDSPLASPEIREEITGSASVFPTTDDLPQHDFFNFWSNNHIDLSNSLSQSFLNSEKCIQRLERFRLPLLPQPPRYTSIGCETFDSNCCTQINFPLIQWIPQLRISRPSKPSSQSTKSSPIKPCGYCVATNKYPQDHARSDCPELAMLKPCKICFASGRQNHTLTHCPYRRKVYLKLKDDRHNDNDKNERKDGNDKDKRKDSNGSFRLLVTAAKQPSQQPAERGS